MIMTTLASPGSGMSYKHDVSNVRLYPLNLLNDSNNGGYYVCTHLCGCSVEHFINFKDSSSIKSYKDFMTTIPCSQCQKQ